MTFRILITLFCITWTAAYAQDASTSTIPTLVYPEAGEEIATATPVLEVEVDSFKRTGKTWVRFEIYSDSSLQNLIAKEDVTLGNGRKNILRLAQALWYAWTKSREL